MEKEELKNMMNELASERSESEKGGMEVDFVIDGMIIEVKE